MSTSNSSEQTYDSQSSRRSIFRSPNERKKALRTVLTKTQTLRKFCVISNELLSVFMMEMENIINCRC